MNPLPVCSSSTSCSSDSSPATLSYKHQPLPDQSQRLNSIGDGPVDVEDANNVNNNPVLNQILHDLNLARKTCGDDDPNVADAWNALGLVRIHMQRDALGAKSCHERALRIFQDQKLQLETAITLLDLGYCFERLERREEAMQKYQQALDILQAEKVSEDHPQVMSTKRAMSRILRR